MVFHGIKMKLQCLEGAVHGHLPLLQTVRCRKAYAPRRERLSVLAAQADVAITRRKGKILLSSTDV